MYIETINPDVALSYTLVALPRGNYTAAPFVIIIESLLQTRFPDFVFSCSYNHNVGTSEMTNPTNLNFRITTNGFVLSLQGDVTEWYGNHLAHGIIGQPDNRHLRSINGGLRN